MQHTENITTFDSHGQGLFRQRLFDALSMPGDQRPESYGINEIILSALSAAGASRDDWVRAITARLGTEPRKFFPDSLSSVSPADFPAMTDDLLQDSFVLRKTRRTYYGGTKIYGNANYVKLPEWFLEAAVGTLADLVDKKLGAGHEPISLLTRADIEEKQKSARNQAIEGRTKQYRQESSDRCEAYAEIYSERYHTDVTVREMNAAMDKRIKAHHMQHFNLIQYVETLDSYQENKRKINQTNFQRMISSLTEPEFIKMLELLDDLDAKAKDRNCTRRIEPEEVRGILQLSADFPASGREPYGEWVKRALDDYNIPHTEFTKAVSSDPRATDYEKHFLQLQGLYHSDTTIAIVKEALVPLIEKAKASGQQPRHHTLEVATGPFTVSLEPIGQKEHESSAWRLRVRSPDIRETDIPLPLSFSQAEVLLGQTAIAIKALGDHPKSIAIDDTVLKLIQEQKQV